MIEFNLVIARLVPHNVGINESTRHLAGKVIASCHTPILTCHQTRKVVAWSQVPVMMRHPTKLFESSNKPHVTFLF